MHARQPVRTQQPDLDVDLRRTERLLALRLTMLADQARRYPLPVVVSSTFLAVIVWRHVPGLAIGAWVMGLAVILTARWIYCGYAARVARTSGTRTALRTILLLSICNGVITGMAVVLFFERLPLDLKAIFTMVMVCWSAGAVSANAAYTPSFYGYTIPILLPLSVAWALDATFEGIGLALLILMFLVIQAWLARDNHKLLMNTFDVDLENERLVEELKAKRVELEAQQEKTAAARDRAEAANRSKNQFIAAASHDLKQPLFSMSLQVTRLLDNPDPKIVDAGTRIGGLVQDAGLELDDLLDIARLDAGMLLPRDDLFSLRDAAAKAIELDQDLAGKKHLTTLLDIDETIMLRLDRSLFGRMLRNLVHNAVKYTAQGSVSVSARFEGPALVVEVADTGIGVPLELHRRVFEPYYRVDGASSNREDGFGLGLSIVRQFTDLLGLDLELHSAPSAGSTFSIRIPGERVVHVAQPIAETATPEPVLLPSGLRVLLVDDDVRVLQALSSQLERWHCRVETARSVAEALQAATERVPEMIVADYQLEAGETGVMVVKRVRELGFAVPALIVSGDASAAVRADAASAKLSVVDKAVDPGTLGRAIMKVLDDASAAATSPTIIAAEKT